jgi:tetratricopeptide (TPR) repeat protein
MKNKLIAVATGIFISVSGFAQKEQLKAAEKALKNGNSAEAKTTLASAESLIGAASEGEKAQFYFLKGNALLDLVKKDVDAKVNAEGAAAAYQQLIATEKSSGKSKYTPQAEISIRDLKTKIFNLGVAENEKKNYKGASDLFYQLYSLDKTNLDNLYYAASFSVNGKEYDTALKQYDELLKAKYTGQKTIYWAKSLISNEEEQFANPADRKRATDLKTHIGSRDEKVPSKLGEIYKNITDIYITTNRIEEAKKAIKDARTVAPDNTDLIIAEANLYLQTKDNATYKKLITEALQKNPNNAELYFNLGVVASQNKEVAESQKYYQKAIEIDPKNAAAYLNLSVSKLDAEKEILNKMNKLGTSAADVKKYDEYKKQRSVILKETLPYLEKALEFSDKENSDAISSTLISVYRALDMGDKAKALKAKLGK